MIYHVLPGDSLVEEFKKTQIEGEIIVCREALIAGPIDAETHEQFWNERAQFIVSDYGDDEIVYHERVANELERLEEVDPGDEVNLWFEYELFCQVNMWFCLSRLAGSGASIYRVAPALLEKEDRWKGFGRMNSDDLRACFAARTMLSADDIGLALDLWEKYRSRDVVGLIQMAETPSTAFPYLDETAVAAAEIDTRPFRILREIRSEGLQEFDAIFAEFSKRAGVFGLGDLQVSRMLDQLDQERKS